MRLDGKVALLTGAAAAMPGELMGFGGAAANLFVREGAKVVLTDIRDDLGERSAAALREGGAEARYMHLDVTSEDDWTAAVDATMAAFGRLDILFNNAGTGHEANCELNYTPVDEEVISVEKALKLHAQFNVAKQFWAHLIKKGAIKDPKTFINQTKH